MKDKHAACPTDSLCSYSAFRHKGFSFTEVMFAVIILGIGFIMVAGIFPVSLQQAKQSSEEIAGAALARGAVSVLGEVFTDDSLLGGPNARGRGDSTTPSPAQVGPLTMDPANTAWTGLHGNGLVPAYPAWKATLGNMISPQDPRYAWTALYRRDGNFNDPDSWAPYAQVYVFALVNRNADRFQSNVDGTQPGGPSPNGPLPNLQPKPVRVAVLDNVIEAGGVDLIAIQQEGNPPTDPDYTGAAAEGAYVVICKDEMKPLASAGRMNGRMFRLGARRDDFAGGVAPFTGLSTAAIVFELQPGNDLAPDGGIDGVLHDPAIPPTAAFAADDVRSIGILPPVLLGSAITFDNLSLAAIIGRGYADPAAGMEFTGTSMVVGAYTGLVKINR